MRLLVVLWALLLANACAGPLEYYVSPEFGPEQVSLIEEAAHRWNLATDAELVVIAGYDEQVGTFDLQRDWRTVDERVVYPLSRESADYEVLRVFKAGGEHFSGMYNRYGGTIVIVEGLPDDVFLSVVMHEFGHALGSKHTDGGLMFRSAQGTCIGPVELEMVCDAYGCGDNAGPTC